MTVGCPSVKMPARFVLHTATCGLLAVALLSVHPPLSIRTESSCTSTWLDWQLSTFTQYSSKKVKMYGGNLFSTESKKNLPWNSISHFLLYKMHAHKDKPGNLGETVLEIHHFHTWAFESYKVPSRRRGGNWDTAGIPVKRFLAFHLFITMTMIIRNKQNEHNERMVPCIKIQIVRGLRGRTSPAHLEKLQSCHGFLKRHFRNKGSFSHWLRREDTPIIQRQWFERGDVFRERSTSA